MGEYSQAWGAWRVECRIVGTKGGDGNLRGQSNEIDRWDGAKREDRLNVEKLNDRRGERDCERSTRK